jgi:protein phosphatase 1 regulatory subunit 7
MSSSEPAPPAEHDPATTSAATTQSHEEEKKDHKPRDSKGWDGKLRLDKKVLSGEQATEGDAQSDAEESEEEGFKVEDGPPPEQIGADEDLLEDMDEDEEDIDLVHLRIASIPSLKLERFKKLRVSCFLPRFSSHLNTDSVFVSDRTK